MSIAIVPVIVPTSGEGPIADISALVGPKTVTLTGRFVGTYTLLASHNNVNFVPALLFDTDGVEQIRLTLPDAFTSVRFRCGAGTAGSVTATVAGISVPADNLFGTLTTFTPNSSSTSSIIDTAALFPPSGLEKDINIICEGGFRGDLVVEGSNDGLLFNPIGQFSAGQQQRPLLGIPADLEFSPLSIEANTRYLRFTLTGQVYSPVVVTIGGTIPISEASGAGISIDEDRGGQAINYDGPNPGIEVILYEWEKTFTGLAGTITAILTGIARVLPVGMQANGVFNVYIGATTPGDTTGGTICITFNTGANVETGFTVSGAPFANPGGTQLIQITGQVTAPGLNPGDISQADIRGIGLNIG